LAHKRAGQLICPPWQIKSAPLGAANQPDGQITSDFQKWCQAPFAKIFQFQSDPNQFTASHRLVPQEGRIAIVTNAGRDAMDVGSARDERGLPAYGQVVSF
jgi:hypothetical protein